MKINIWHMIYPNTCIANSDKLTCF